MNHAQEVGRREQVGPEEGGKGAGQKSWEAQAPGPASRVMNWVSKTIGGTGPDLDYNRPARDRSAICAHKRHF